MNNFTRVFLRSKEEKEILQGFPWVFDNEISHLKHRPDEASAWTVEQLENSTVPDGSVVEVYTKAGGFCGTGVINRKSRITIRIISSEHADAVLADICGFWRKRIAEAAAMRGIYFTEDDSYRLVFAEADFVPGLICERFRTAEGRTVLVVQFLSLSCEVFRGEIIAALEEVCSPDGIYERSDAAVREKEGLEPVSGWIMGGGDTGLTITENGILLSVDIARGQKTGYFLDQKFNRRRAAAFCAGKSVLDTFTHTGAFGLNAVKAGARNVISVDISQEAVDMVNRNIALNGAGERMSAVCADVFALLKEYEVAGRKFDVIILDPPAFTKSARMIEKAYGGYKEINLRAMRLLNSGGILVSCSCSHFFDRSMFLDMLMHSATDSHRCVQILEMGGAGPDHPVLLGYQKSEYLKFAICRVM